MQRCNCCRRYLLVGETFGLYRRRLRATVVVCELCQARALRRGWRALRGSTFRQHTRRPRVLRADTRALSLPF